MQSAENVPPKSIPEREEDVLAFWKHAGIFQLTLKQTEHAEPYVFYDGPPFATGLPHYGHILAGTIKDVIPRYQTMRGHYVRREWGWDCHGLPLENLIEKELGFEHKKQIEEYGVENFNQKARESVLRYDSEWKTIVPRMGRWVDMEKSYKTMDASYSESIWWAFKTLYNKKLIYEGYKSMHICPRCETTLAISEVGMNYKDTKDISVYVEFELVDEPGTSLIAWTTTPWTLPGNVAVAVNPEIEYVKIEKQDEGTGPTVRFIVAKDLLQKHFGTEGYTVLGTFAGKELVGKSYKPLFDYYASDEKLENRENGWKVYPADFVTTQDGTGIVHEAPAFGEVDMELGKKMKLPFVQHVTMDGHMKPEVKDFAGMPVKPKSDDDKIRLATDIAILRYLQEHGTLFAKENINHSYPYCWRCDTPLLNYAASSWFVNVGAIKDRLVSENKEVLWVPENVGSGRFGNWLEGARDWAISRSRYWGAPLPVWKCNKCGKVDVLGDIEELKKATTADNTYYTMRHGEAETNTLGIVSYKTEDKYHLTQNGQEQVEASVTKLKEKKIDLIISSPILRTKETAELIHKKLGLTEDALIFDERLREVNTGDFNGCTIDTYRKYFVSTLEKFTKPSPGGETLREMKNRLGEFLYDIEQQYSGKNILFVTHEYDVWLLETIAKGMDEAESAWVREAAGDDYVDNAEIRELAFAPIPHNRNYELDFHRPYIDEVVYHCSCELGTLTRIPEVFDCWFESGSMPYASVHYMGDERTPEGKLFKSNFPANFIAEGLDQTRGWFYSMLVLSVGLFDQTPFKSVIVNGLILAEDGQKMSKKLKNYPDPLELVSKYGADALRMYLLASPVMRGEDLRFSEKGVDEVFKKIVLRTDNVRSFFDMYRGSIQIPHTLPSSAHVLDRWIVARFAEVHSEVTRGLTVHELDRAARPVAPFIDDLSTWYLRRSRERFKDEESDDARLAVETTGWILYQLAKLLAPFMPFIAEDLYQRLPMMEKKPSVHLESWENEIAVDKDILDEMQSVRKVVSYALELRAANKVKVRQPLNSITLHGIALPTKELQEIIREEVNVKQVIQGETREIQEEIASMDFHITNELAQEGEQRELVRQIQEMRKNAKLTPKDPIRLRVTGDKGAQETVQRALAELRKVAHVTELVVDGALTGEEMEIGKGRLIVALERIG